MSLSQSFSSETSSTRYTNSLVCFNSLTPKLYLRFGVTDAEPKPTASHWTNCCKSPLSSVSFMSLRSFSSFTYLFCSDNKLRQTNSVNSPWIQVNLGEPAPETYNSFSAVAPVPFNYFPLFTVINIITRFYVQVSHILVHNLFPCFPGSCHTYDSTVMAIGRVSSSTTSCRHTIYSSTSTGPPTTAAVFSTWLSPARISRQLTSPVEDVGFSDHCMIQWETSLLAPSPSYVTRERRSWKNF